MMMWLMSRTLPIITETRDYNGFVEKARRLGLEPLVAEATATLTGFKLLIEERPLANGTYWIRKPIDDGFAAFGGWVKKPVGGIDWTKQNVAGGATIGVEVQVSGRSDMLAVDVLHLAEALIGGLIDIGLIIVPNDQLSRFLTDRTPNLRTALRHVNSRAREQPIRILAFAHDGTGPALPKLPVGRAAPQNR